MFNEEPTAEGSLYAIVLAGGQGERLRPLTRRLMGSPAPKQYLPLVSPRSLLQETQARLATEAKPHRTFVIADRTWAPLAKRQLQSFDGVRVVAQPRSAGTAAGLLMPLCHVMAMNPEATVVVTPSDHHYDHGAAFGEAVRVARTAVGAFPRRICLLAVRADHAATDLGWLVQGAPLDGPQNKSVRHVERFVEKPAPAVAEALAEHGAVWNTMVMVARASTLWRTIFRHSPRLASAMEPMIRKVGSWKLEGELEELYRRIPEVDLSESVLSRADNLIACTMQDAGWFDCGTPERLFDWLRRSPNSRSPFRRLIEEDRAA